MSIRLSCRKLVPGLFIGLLLLSPSSGLARDWDDWNFRASIAGTSNVGLNIVSRTDSDGNQSTSQAMNIRPYLETDREGGRGYLKARYAPNLQFRFGDETRLNMTHFLRANGEAELVDKVFFLGGSASAGLVQNTESSTPVDFLSGGDEYSQSYSLSLFPKYRQHLNRYADLVSSNSLRYSWSGNAEGTRTIGLNLGLQDGRHFSRLGWSLGYTLTNSSNSSRDDTTYSLTSGVSYRVDRNLQVNGSIGYSGSDAPSSRDRDSSANWSAGASWTPNSRTSVSGNFGNDYAGRNWNVRVTHKVRRADISAFWSQGLTDTSTLIAEPFIPVDSEGEPLINPETDQPYDPLFVGVPSDEQFINNSAGFTISRSGRLTKVALSGVYSFRDYEVSTQSNENALINLTASRDLGRKTSVFGSLGYSVYTGDPGTGAATTDDSTTTLRVGYRHQLGRRVAFNTSLMHRVRDADPGGYTENRLSVNLSIGFD